MKFNSPFAANLAWFSAAGQMPEEPTPDARQTAFYIGMQLEELAEKLRTLLPGTGVEVDLAALILCMEHEADKFKKGSGIGPAERAYDYVTLAASALAQPAKAKDMLDGDIDMLWVTVGGARAQGADVEGAYKAAATANWAKGNPDGTFNRHPETGKVLEPQGWAAPDLSACIHPALK